MKNKTITLNYEEYESLNNVLNETISFLVKTQHFNIARILQGIILKIKTAKDGTERVVYLEPKHFQSWEAELCSECRRPTRYWLDPHTPLCQDCAGK